MENENLKPKFTKEGKSARSLSINEEANEHSQLLKRLDFAPKLGAIRKTTEDIPMIKLEKEYDVMNLTRNKSKILRDSNQLFLSCPHKDEFEEAQEASDSNNLSRTRAKTKSSFYSRLGKLADIEDIDNANEIKYSLDCADIASGLGDEGILDLNFQEDYEGFSFSASSKFSKLSEIVHEPHDNQDINEDSEIINSTVLFKLEELSLKRHLLSASFKFKTF